MSPFKIEIGGEPGGEEVDLQVGEEESTQKVPCEFQVRGGQGFVAAGADWFAGGNGREGKYSALLVACPVDSMKRLVVGKNESDTAEMEWQRSTGPVLIRVTLSRILQVVEKGR
ncbi:MAG: hypothetical protein WC841_05225 [Candidatus Shapirobacteria bacterium]|jgi:hypothetical protein